MIDPVIERVAKALHEYAKEANPAEVAAYFVGLAQTAQTELARTIITSDSPIPTAKFLAIQAIPHTSTWKQIAQESTGPNMTTAVTTYLEREGRGELWVVEIKRVVKVEP